MRKASRLLCIVTIWLAAQELPAQTVSTRAQCESAADRQLDECTGWGHHPQQCWTTYNIVIGLCEQQFPE